MPEVGPRSLRRSLTPGRLAFAALTIAAIVAGFVIALIGPDLQLAGLVISVLGIGGLFAGVVFPVIRDVEIGYPRAIGVHAALRKRDHEILAAFTAQKHDFTLCAQLLSPDPGVATAVLEAAWANAAAEWRGPVTTALRARVLGSLLHLLAAHEERCDPGVRASAASRAGVREVAGLPLAQRAVVVLHEYAGLPLAGIARMTGRRVADVADDLRTAQLVVGGCGVEDSP